MVNVYNIKALVCDNQSTDKHMELHETSRNLRIGKKLIRNITLKRKHGAENPNSQFLKKYIMSFPGPNSLTEA